MKSLLTRHNASALLAWLTLALLTFPIATQGQQAPTSLGNRMSVKGNNSTPQLRQGTKTPSVKKAGNGAPRQNPASWRPPIRADPPTSLKSL